MRRITGTFAAAALLLLAASAVHAEGLNRPPFHPKPGPIEGGVLDPTDPCILHANLCDPTDPPPPPPDPCIENPQLCEPPPPPPNPCDLSPLACEDPPVADPGDTVASALAGTATVRAGGTKATESFTATLNFDTSARTFLLMDSGGALYTGNLAPKGNTGRKFSMFLDANSGNTFAAFVAARGAAAAGSSAGSVLGDSSKIVLTVDENGAALSVKIKSQVLTSGLGEVVFKTNLTPSQP